MLFQQNTTPLPDEMLAHRLGLVPLISRNVMNGLRYTRVSSTACQVQLSRDSQALWRMSLTVRQDCDCDEGCYYCMIMLRLKVSHSGTGSDKFMNVTSNMLEVIPSPGGVSFAVSGDGIRC